MGAPAWTFMPARLISRRVFHWDIPLPALDNPKHELFAQELAKGISQAIAYESAGYKASEQHASRLASSGKVQARLAEIQNRAVIRTEITLASLLQEAAEIQRAAKEAGQHSAAVAALTAKAKLAGLWVDKSETENVNTNYVVSGEPIDNVEDWEREHAPKH